MKKSQFLIAGTGSGSGKTTITLGLIAAFKKRGFSISPFKCGPDYIDTSFHAMLAEKNAHNLDLWMVGEEKTKEIFQRETRESDISIVEGVMGYFDGLSPLSDEGSSADIAQKLDIPVILVANAKGAARSFAALVKGFIEFSTPTQIIGVIANHISSQRHADILSEVLKSEKLPPLLGTVPKDEKLHLPERHLGLITSLESGIDQEWVNHLTETIEVSIDLDRLLAITQKHSCIISKEEKQTISERVCIAYAYDRAFSFYYAENLRLLQEAGAKLIPFSPLKDREIPQEAQALYIGGGFPELYKEELSNNSSMINSIKEFTLSGKSVYAECGGLIYLSQYLEEKSSPMVGLLSGFCKMSRKLRKLGYREVTLKENCFWGKSGTKIRGHEFHYSEYQSNTEEKKIYNLSHPTKGDLGDAGIQKDNLIASYIHLHFASNPEVVSHWIEFIKKG